MARKRYDLAFHIDSSRAEAPAKRLVRLLENAEAAAKRAGAAMEGAYNRAATAANHAASAMAAAASRMPTGGGPGGGGGARTGGDGSRSGGGGDTQGIEDRYFRADFERRARYEARKEQLAANAAAQATRKAKAQSDQLSQIEDNFLRADYQRRARYEARKQQLVANEAARAASKAATQAAQDARKAASQSDQLSQIEDRFSRADYQRRTRFEARKQLLAANEAAQAASKAASQADQLSQIEDRYTQRDYASRVAYERRQITQKERTNRQLAAIEDRYLRDEYRKRMAYQARVQRASEQAAAAAAAQNEQILMRGVAVVSTAALAGLRVLHDTYGKIHADAERAAEASFANRRNLRTESVLKGAERTTNKELLESFQFRAETSLNEADATEFTRQYLGSVPIARQKGNITPKVEAELMKEAGIMAARQGGDAGTRGELAGLLGQFGKVDSAQSGMAQLEAIRVALTEGRGDDTPLTRQLLQSAGSMVREGGPVGTLAEQAALIGVTSLSAGPEASATRAEQLSRGLRAGLTKMVGGKGTKEPQGKYLKRLGITEKDSLESALDKLIPDIRKARAGGREADVYLAEHGFRGEEERKAIVEVEGVYEQLKDRFKAAREAGAGGGAAAAKANARYLASPEGRAAVGDALAKAAEQTRGIRGERMAAYMREAVASPEFQESEKSPSAAIGDRLTGYLSGAFHDPVEFGRTTRLQGIAGRIQRQRALDVGVSEEDLTNARHKSYRAGGDFLEENFNLVDQLISQKGGNLSANTTPVMDRLAQALEENNRLVKENNARMGPPPPIAAPAPRPLGPRP